MSMISTDGPSLLIGTLPNCSLDLLKRLRRSGPKLRLEFTQRVQSVVNAFDQMYAKPIARVCCDASEGVRQSVGISTPSVV